MATHTIEPADHRLLVAGEWAETGEWIDVENPYDGSPVGRVPKADAALAERAIATAAEAFAAGPAPQHERAAILERAARLVAEREDELTLHIAAEAGKPLKTARVEAQRCVDTLTFSAGEARRLTGHTVPMEGGSAGEGKLGLLLRVPLGVVAAISPFNFPLNLVAHKLGPALAAGNAVVLKPASQTPLSALKLGEILLEAGLDPAWLGIVCGSGSEVGGALTAHDAVAAITFTGSAEVGWGIRESEPRKRVNLELGSTSPLVVHSDGDWQTAADKATVHAFSHAGQSCISVQRILVHADIADAFCERFVAGVKELTVGDPLDEDIDVGPLIDSGERDRVREWVSEAVDAGTKLETGGEVVDEGRCLAPTVLREPDRDLRIWREEVFGPVATVTTYSDWDEAVELANDARYGLNAGVFTGDVSRALDAGRRLRFGTVLVNEVPTFRTDQMPYGGVKDSGNTREGPAYAVRELSEARFLSLQ